MSRRGARARRSARGSHPPLRLCIAHCVAACCEDSQNGWDSGLELGKTLQMQMFGAVSPEVRISSAGRVFRRLQRKSLPAADVPGAPRKSSGG